MPKCVVSLSVSILKKKRAKIAVSRSQGIGERGTRMAHAIMEIWRINLPLRTGNMEPMSPNAKMRLRIQA